MANPQSKADMDPSFERQLRQLKAHAASQYTARSTGGQNTWYRPVNWNGDPSDFDGLSDPFNRDTSNDALVNAISDAKNPGTVGDVVACSIMINYLSVLERGFRVRHTLRRVRATAHMMGREKGQGDDQGPFIQLGVEYVRGVLKQSKKVQS
jgi:hypothetical protein